MWEVGYAMALGRPTIIVTQSLDDLPFDIRDMQSLQYDRSQLRRTLGQPLQQMVVDTVALQGPGAIQVSREDELVGELLAEVRDLKSMVAEAVKSRNFERLDSPESIATERVRESLQGAWSTAGTNLYARVVNGQLIVPYCFRGDSDLTGVYFGRRKSGEYWFSRFAWINEPITGFTFLKHESMDVLRGAWWTSARNVFESSSIPEMPPRKVRSESSVAEIIPKEVSDMGGKLSKEGATGWALCAPAFGKRLGDSVTATVTMYV